MKQKTIGVIFVILTALMWALESIFLKLSFTNADFIQTAAINSIFAATIALAYFLFSERKQFGNLTQALKMSKKEWLVTLYVGVLATALTDLLYFLAMSKAPVVNVVLIAHTQTIFVIIIGYFIFKEEKVSTTDVIGIAMMFIAALFVTTGSFENLKQLRFGTVYELLVIVAVILWAAAGIFVKKYMREKSSAVVTFYRSLIAAIILVVYLLIKGRFVISSYYQILVGLSVGIGFIFYYEGLKRIKAAQVSTLELTAPFFAAFLGFIVLGETITSFQMIGLVFLVPGIYFLAKHEEN